MNRVKKDVKEKDKILYSIWKSGESFRNRLNRFQLIDGDEIEDTSPAAEGNDEAEAGIEFLSSSVPLKRPPPAQLKSNAALLGRKPKSAKISIKPVIKPRQRSTVQHTNTDDSDRSPLFDEVGSFDQANGRLSNNDFSSPQLSTGPSTSAHHSPPTREAVQKVPTAYIDVVPPPPFFFVPPPFPPPIHVPSIFPQEVTARAEVNTNKGVKSLSQEVKAKADVNTNKGVKPLSQEVTAKADVNTNKNVKSLSQEVTAKADVNINEDVKPIIRFNKSKRLPVSASKTKKKKASNQLSLKKVKVENDVEAPLKVVFAPITDYEVVLDMDDKELIRQYEQNSCSIAAVPTAKDAQVHRLADASTSTATVMRQNLAADLPTAIAKQQQLSAVASENSVVKEEVLLPATPLPDTIHLKQPVAAETSTAVKPAIEAATANQQQIGVGNSKRKKATASTPPPSCKKTTNKQQKRAAKRNAEAEAKQCLQKFWMLGQEELKLEVELNNIDTKIGAMRSELETMMAERSQLEAKRDGIREEKVRLLSNSDLKV